MDIVDARPASTNDWVAPDCHGRNFFTEDHALRSLLPLYLDAGLLRHLTPHYERLGHLAGNELDDLARVADRHEPVLHPRDSRGRDADWIEFHPAYRAMERIGYGEFGLHCMSRRPGVFGWPTKIPAPAKYVFTYLFTQAEFGIMCPISLTDTSAMLIERYGDAALRARYLPRLHSQDMGEFFKCAQFMTEKPAGSDVGNVELEARFEDGYWRLYGEKWFCSSADADLALLLARPQGAPQGGAGLGIFLLPRVLEDGSRNRYRTVRLKPKLGTRSMASGEIIFEGAIAHPLGTVRAGPNQGLKQMLDQVNLSRLSHAVRAAGMMRRCLNEALVVARNRYAFGGAIIRKPLLRRQLMKLMVPTEQALSMMLFAASQLEAAEAGDAAAARLIRILTPIVKFRACRDNVPVATGAMEVRGGNGYIEDFVNARLIRDAQIGLLWEGTSNINALDVTTRAVAKLAAHKDLGADLTARVEAETAIPGQMREELASLAERAVAFADRVGASGNETLARRAADALYHVTSATLMACEGARLGALGGDARRLLLARLVVNHRLRPMDPLEADDGNTAVVDALLTEAPVGLERAAELVV
jgi:alkylation response protein AidB-like acyl-CoA dehydrogenase